jgi:hypothetical protein
MRWLRLIFSHSVFVSICAAALTVHSAILLSVKPDFSLIALVFFCTLLSYNAYWIISRNSTEIGPWRLLGRKDIPGLSLLAISLAGAFYFFSQVWFLWLPIAIAALLTVSYFLPVIFRGRTFFFQNAGPLKTILLAVAWSYVTVRLAVPAATFIPGNIMLVIMVQRFLFMLMLCIIFDFRDIKIDRVLHLHSLATNVSKRALNVIFFLSLSGFMVITFFLHHRLLCPVHTPVSAFSGLAAGALYLAAWRPRGYFFYYFLVDGMMLLLASSSLICSFFD